MVLKLHEKDFIQDDFHKEQWPMWVFLLIIISVLAGYVGVRRWQDHLQQSRLEERPFFAVSNRELSVFLWQHPEYMRAHARSKSAYLTAFEYLGDVTVNPKRADEWVVAPRELLYRFHQWRRLLGGKVFGREISRAELLEFLEDDEQWSPAYWPGAPEHYVAAHGAGFESLKRLPPVVRQAFEGWIAYKKEGDQVNALEVSGKELREFIASHPQYARANWYQTYQEMDLNYLGSLEDVKGTYPLEEIPSFLRWAVHTSRQLSSLAFSVKSTKPASITGPLGPMASSP